MCTETPVVVVPDGLAADPRTGTALPEPSFVYRAVLDHVLQSVSEGTPVYLSPANDFGGPLFEQQAAARYLADRGFRSHIDIPTPAGRGYVDTRGNARELRLWLQNRGLWPLPAIALYSTSRHARRAKHCFRREGFVIATVVAVPYAVPVNAAVVRRLWYYRFPAVHSAYERLALLRETLRDFFSSPEPS